MTHIHSKYAMALLTCFTTIVMSSCLHNGSSSFQDSDQSNRAKAERLYYKGVPLACDKEYSKALTIWESSHNTDKTYLNPIYGIIHIYSVYAKKYNPGTPQANFYREKSLTYSKELISADKNNPSAYYLAGLYSETLNDFSSAITYYERALQYEPRKSAETEFNFYSTPDKKVSLYYGVALCYGQTKDYVRCLRYLKQFVRNYVDGGQEPRSSLLNAQALIPQIERYLACVDASKNDNLSKRPQESQPQSKPTSKAQTSSKPLIKFSSSVRGSELQAMQLKIDQTLAEKLEKRSRLISAKHDL